jgi:predicted glycosyltransferase
MKILFDINHPAHVHLYKNLIWELKKKNHDIFVTAKVSPIIENLLNLYQIPYRSLAPKGKNILIKLFNQVKSDLKLFTYIKKNRIEIGVGISFSVALLSRFTEMVSVINDDDDPEVTRVYSAITHTFGDHVMTPNVIKWKKHLNKQISYPGTHEIAYLHPNWFIPNDNIYYELGIPKGTKYVILRFNEFNAHHDMNESGLSFFQKEQLIKQCLEYGSVFITNEGSIHPIFQKYQLSIPAHRIHDALFFATLYVGDSQTMTSEAAILGTPSFKCNSFSGRLSVPNILENRYNLCYSFKNECFDQMLSKIKDVMKTGNSKEIWAERRQLFYKENIDVTAFFYWFIETYPHSKVLVKNIDTFWERFK